MNIGQLSIVIAFIAALLAAYLYYSDGRSRLKSPRRGAAAAPGRKKLTRRLFHISVAAGLVASVILFYLLLTHQFEYSYVYRYSSRALPALYLISAFWAGQEGTFLLWAILTGIMGWILLRTTKSEDGYAMAVVSAFSAFLYLLMIVKSPFETTLSVPLDGAGLNPLLQDPWMAIHPPVLFVGYAATIFPFALVLSGLARRNYENWFASGFPWTLFASLALGAGIIIGGFWAYEVLGWGGYWGWDPVENSSLVPWLTLLALIHGLVVQRAKGSLMRTNLFLALVSFILVLYATFLTRSGVLADFSVHSFVDLGINNYLIAIMVISTVLGFGLFVTRFGEFRSPRIDTSSINRELTLLLGLFVLCAGAVFTWVGMSSPILTGLIGKASQVDISFYNKVNLPVAIGIALLLGITPFLGWKEEQKTAFLKRLSMPLVLTALSTVIAYVAGVTSAALLVFVAMAAFALISNTVIAFRQYRSSWMNLAGPVAHIGVALLLIGIVGSGSFDESTKLVLQQDEPQSAHGYQFTFKGVTERDALKPRVNIEVSDGKSSFVASPSLYYSEYNKSMMREPDIKILPLMDLYISPLELKEFNPMYELTKGETKDIGGYQVTFVGYDMGQQQHGQAGTMAVGAVLDVEVDGTKHQVVPKLVIDGQGGRKALPVDLPPLLNGRVPPQIGLNSMNVEQKKVYLELIGFRSHMGNAGTDELVVDISTKPLMMVVWTGVVLIIVGTAIGWRRRMMAVD